MISSATGMGLLILMVDFMRFVPDRRLSRSEWSLEPNNRGLRLEIAGFSSMIQATFHQVMTKGQS
jgi:hypothetical protein